MPQPISRQRVRANFRLCLRRFGTQGREGHSGGRQRCRVRTPGRDRSTGWGAGTAIGPGDRGLDRRAGDGKGDGTSAQQPPRLREVSRPAAAKQQKPEPRIRRVRFAEEDLVGTFGEAMP